MGYVVLNEHEQNRPEKYPHWCDLSWFHDCRNLDNDVEPHYHDLAEIWLWREGAAEASVAGETIQMRAGVMVYTPPQCLHSYKSLTRHSNTGIAPRAYASARRGHLHVEETGEILQPPMSAFWFDPEGNSPKHPVVFPREAFLQGAYSGRYVEGQQVFEGSRESWWGVLVREGTLTAKVQGKTVDLSAADLLLINASVHVELCSKECSEAAFALGWPLQGKEAMT